MKTTSSRTTIVSVMNRDIRGGMFLSDYGLTVASNRYNLQTGKRDIAFTDGGSMSLEEIGSVSVQFSVPDHYLNFEDFNFISAKKLTESDIHETSDHYWSVNVPDGYYYVTGSYGYGVLVDWPGCGYSTVPFSMKCYVSNSIIYRPDTENRIGHYCQPIAHITNWYALGTDKKILGA